MIFILSINSFSQKRDSLIQLYPGLGDTLDLFDRNYFELFQNIEGFEYAVFYIRNDEHLVSKVTYYLEGSLRDTIFIQKLWALDNARQNIEQIEKENEKKYESPEEYIIETKNGSKYICEIEMFSKNNIYFRTEETSFTKLLNNSKFKMDYSNVETLILVGETNTWSCMGYGALIGLGIGLIAVVASSSGGDSGGGFAAGLVILAIPFAAVIGGIAGLVAGLTYSTSDEVFPLDYQDDLLQLKNYAKYNFRYEESLEQIYIEIE
jgi:hypothetical protein